MRVHAPHVFELKLVPREYLYVLAPGMCEYSRCVHLEAGGQGANTYFNKNSRNIFPCIRAIAAACIRTKFKSPRMFFLHVLVLCRGGKDAGKRKQTLKHVPRFFFSSPRST